MKDAMETTDTSPGSGKVAAPVDVRWVVPLRHRIAVTITGVAGFVLIVLYGWLVALNPGVRDWGQRVLVDINGWHNPGWDTFGRLLSTGFSPPYAFAMIVVLVIVLAIGGRRLGDALFVGLSIGVVYACTYLVKLLVRRPRPAALPYVVPGLAPETDPSYPSGHVAIVTSIVVILVLVARRGWRRWLIGAVGALLIVATGFARLYVGVHYPDDVVASVVYVTTVGPMLYAALSWIENRWSIVNRVDHWAGQRWAYLS